MSKKQQPISPPVVSPPAVSQAPDKKPAPFVTADMVWALLAELAVDRVATAARDQVKRNRAKSRTIMFYPPTETQQQLIEVFAAQVASMERTACLDAIEAAHPDWMEGLADLIGKRGPLKFTLSATFTKDGKWAATSVWKYGMDQAACEFAIAE